MLFSDIHNMLSEHQLQVLGFLAYTGTSMSDRTLNVFSAKFNIDELKVRSVIRELFFNNLLGANSMLIKYNTLPVLVWIVENKPEWLSIYSSIDIQGKRSLENSECLKLVNALYKGEPTFLRRDISYNYESLLPLLCPLISNDLFKKEMCLMPISTFREYVRVLIPLLLDNDINEAMSLLQVWDSKEEYKERANEEWALTLMYVFFANGEIPEKYSLPNTWHKSVIDGTGYLLKNQFREASECFKKALMCQPTDAFFPDYISNYLYSLSLILENSSESRMKMYDIANKRFTANNIECLPVKILSSYYKDNKHVVDDVSLKTFCEYAQNSHQQGLILFAYILSNAMRRNYGGFKNAGIRPNLWIIQNECSCIGRASQNSALISRTQSNRSQSNNIFASGGSNNIASVSTHADPQKRTIPPHQKTTKSVSQYSSNVSSNSVEHSICESSLVYVMKEDNLLFPFLKCNNRDSNYSFKEIDTLDYMKGRIGTKNVTDIDRQMWGLWKSSGYKFPIDRVMPILTNSKKLYTLVDGEFCLAKAVYFSPYLEVNVKDDSFEVISEIDILDIPRTGRVICNVSKGLVRYSVLSEEIKSVIMQVLSRKVYPLNFEEQLHLWFTRLRNCNIDVRGESYAAGMAPVVREGSAKLDIIVFAKNNSKVLRYITIIISVPLKLGRS